MTCPQPSRASHLIATISAAALAAALMVSVAAADVKPRRIVSLNLCTDILLLGLVPRERIRAITLNASIPATSPIAGEIAGIELVRGHAEEVLALDPDLVLTGTYTTAATTELLRRLGRRVEVVPLATDFAGIRHAIRQVAAAVGEPERGDAVIAGFDRDLAVTVPPLARRPSAIVYQVGGLVSGTESLIDAILAAAGLTNAARNARLGPSGRIALETLVATPPDLVVLADTAGAYRTPVADNLRHPALARLLAEQADLYLPASLWLCGTPHIAQAVAALDRARAGLSIRPHTR